jgi:hypothetical protein
MVASMAILPSRVNHNAQRGRHGSARRRSMQRAWNNHKQEANRRASYVPAIHFSLLELSIAIAA